MSCEGKGEGEGEAQGLGLGLVRWQRHPPWLGSARLETLGNANESCWQSKREQMAPKSGARIA